MYKTSFNSKDQMNMSFVWIEDRPGVSNLGCDTILKDKTGYETSTVVFALSIKGKDIKW